MIYELRTYTVKQGTVMEVAKNAATVSRDIRGDNYGKLEGYWVSEIGHLNQLMHLWSCAYAYSALKRMKPKVHEYKLQLKARGFITNQ